MNITITLHYHDTQTLTPPWILEIIDNLGILVHPTITQWLHLRGRASSAGFTFSVHSHESPGGSRDHHFFLLDSVGFPAPK